IFIGSPCPQLDSAALTPEPSLLAWATYMGFIRLEIDLEAWRGLTLFEQEALVGRYKISGIPLAVAAQDDPGVVSALATRSSTRRWMTIPDPPTSVSEPFDDSHIQRANHNRSLSPCDPSNNRIFRQGYPFFESKPEYPGFNVGLNFVSFQKLPGCLMNILST